MSGGSACTCGFAKTSRRVFWRVVHRNCNHSAFNGWRRTWSRYSEVRCLNCLRCWRTTAAYVTTLSDATYQESI